MKALFTFESVRRRAPLFFFLLFLGVSWILSFLIFQLRTPEIELAQCLFCFWEKATSLSFLEKALVECLEYPRAAPVVNQRPTSRRYNISANGNRSQLLILFAGD